MICIITCNGAESGLSESSVSKLTFNDRCLFLETLKPRLYELPRAAARLVAASEERVAEFARTRSSIRKAA
jgi:hypothetical protein